MMVGMYILQYGVPTLLDAPLQRVRPTLAKLQSLLEELMIWYATMLNWIMEQQKDPNRIMSQKLSDLNQKEWKALRRHRKFEAEQLLRQGAHLAKQRDSKKRSYDHMSATEQRVLEEYDCGQLEKRRDAVLVKKPRHTAK